LAYAPAYRLTGGVLRLQFEVSLMARSLVVQLLAMEMCVSTTQRVEDTWDA
jgi:hypothetical protein